MSSQEWGAVAAFTSSVTWALGSAYYSRLSSKYLPFAINLTRALVAFPLFLATAIFQFGGIGETATALANVEAAQVGWLFLSIFASYGVGDALFILSTRMIGVPSAMAIACIYPLWATLLGAWTTNQNPTNGQWGGLSVTLVGVMIVVLALPRGKNFKGSNRGLGLALAFATSFCWAVNSYAVYRGSQGLAVSLANVIRMGTGILFVWISGRVLAPKSYALLQSADFRKYGWAFLLESYGGAYSYIYGLREALLVVAATLSSLAPVISVPVALLLKLERFSWKRTVGVALTILGLWFLVF